MLRTRAVPRSYSSPHVIFLAILLAFSAFYYPLKTHPTGQLRAADSEGPTSLMLTAAIDLDKEPRCIAVNDETGRVYIGVENGTLVIDGATNDVLMEIPLEHTPLFIAVNPKNNRIYVDQLGVKVIDGATNAVVGEIHESVNDWEIAIDPVANIVYIAHTTTFLHTYDRVVAYDANTLREKFRVNIPGSTKPYFVQSMGVAVNPETNRVYATWSYNHNLYMIDGHTHSIVKNVSITQYSNRILVNPTTNLVYVARSSGGIILDGESLEQVGTYSGDLRAINPPSNLLYVRRDDAVCVLDGNTHSELARLELEDSPHYIAVNPETAMIYVGHRFDKQISVIDGRFTYGDLVIEPGAPEPDQTFTVKVKVTNICHFEAGTTVDLLVDGGVEGSRDVQLGAGEFETLSFELAKGEGTYDIRVDGVSLELSVQCPPVWSPLLPYLPYILGATALVGLAVGAMVLYRRVRKPQITAPTQVLRCPFCGSVIPQGAVFCPSCGKRIAQ